MTAKRLAHLVLILALPVAGCSKKQPAEANTPAARLHLAAQKGDLKLVQSLLAHGCDVDARDEHGWTPLATAAFHGQTKVAEFLISKGANAKAGALHAAAEGGHTDIAKLLIAAGADVNAGEEMGHSPLYGIPEFNGRDVAELLLAHGAEIVPGDTPENKHLLFSAVANGLPDLVDRLLAGGVDVNAPDIYGYGRTLLGEALIRDDKEMAMLLIAHGADINKKDSSGMAPVNYANSFNKDVVELLLAKGAHVNAEAALYEAVMRGDKEIVELFLAHGADPNAKNYEGDTPLDEALARGFADIAEILRKRGAK